jgi:hypothetical protein
MPLVLLSSQSPPADAETNKARKQTRKEESEGSSLGIHFFGRSAFFALSVNGQLFLSLGRRIDIVKSHQKQASKVGGRQAVLIKKTRVRAKTRPGCNQKKIGKR